MQSEEIRHKIDSFPYWRYMFDLNGHLTTSSRTAINRHQWRKEYFFDPLVELLGGSLEGKRVLDLASNAGFWSLCAIEAGCDYVLGIEGRQMHVDQANFVFEVKEVRKSRYDFIASDIFAVDFTRFGNFDVVLCLGLMYHISKHMELMEKISAVNNDVLLIDTELAGIPGSAMRIWHDHTRIGGASVDYELVMTPSRKAVRDLAQQFGYSVAMLKPHFELRNGIENWEGLFDYRGPKRLRRAFICAKETDIDLLPAETEPIEHSAQQPQRTKVQKLEKQIHRQDQRISALQEVLRVRAQKLRNRAQKLQSVKQSKQHLARRNNRFQLELENMKALKASRGWKLVVMLANIKARLRNLRRISR